MTDELARARRRISAVDFWQVRYRLNFLLMLVNL